MNRVVLINAYSAGNGGDGLLVELAVDLVREAVGPDVHISLVAADPDSFSGLSLSEIDLVSPLPGKSRVIRGAAGAIMAVTGGRIGATRGLLTRMRQANLIISVGGGYLRGGHATELLKSTLVHGVQVMAASKAGVPWILLPQSIGPYSRSHRKLLERHLKRANRVFLRDDTSMSDLKALPNVARIADTAILEMSKSPPPRRNSTSHRNGLVIRDLRAPGDYHAQVRKLYDSSDTWMPVVQSTYSGNNDTSFYSEALGVHAQCSLEDALQDKLLNAVVSVRLHGALRSIMLGVPAIHLSYERKGKAAFGDLGLSEYVFDARTFRAQEVRDALDTIQRDPDSYWRKLYSALKTLGQQRDRVRDEIRSAIGSADYR